MSKIKTVSSKEIISRVKRNFNIKHSGWEFEALEWIADALEIMGASPIYEKCQDGFKVCEHRLKVPCPVDYIDEIRLVHTRSEWDHSNNIIKDCHDQSRYIPCINGNKQKDHDYLKTYDRARGEWYELNHNYLRFSFEHGKVIVVYEGLPIDEEGFPCVVDDVNVKEACAWYILRSMLLQGWKHPVINFHDAEMAWTKKNPQGRNSVKMPTPDEYAHFKSNWTDLCRGVSREFRSFN